MATRREQEKRIKSMRVNSYFYTPGSEARDLSVVPDEGIRRGRRKREESPRKRAIKDNRRNAVLFILTAVVTVAMVVLCVNYLGLRSSVYNSENRLSSLEQELSDIIVENNEKQAEIDSGINYTEIYNTAVNEYGMQYPNSSDNKEYSADSSEYVRQYADIPSN